MRKLNVFNSITLDGYFTGPSRDLGWAHEGADEPEFAAFTAGNAQAGSQAGGALVFGRVTYEMMKAFWPTDAAKEMMPEIAGSMNRMEKIVFSRSLRGSDWQGTRVLNEDPVAAIRRLKQEAGPGMTMMGSGTIIAPLAAAGLIDSYQLVVCPIALGAGRTMFEGVPPLRLRQIRSRTFKNGKVFIVYEAA